MSDRNRDQIDILCRTCLGEEVSDEINPKQRQSLFSIFIQPEENNTLCGNITIMDLLKLTVPKLSIEANDLLPKNVCKFCLDKVINIYEFQLKCQQVDCRLRKLIDESSQRQTLNIKDFDDPLTSTKSEETFADLSNILKIEFDEPLLDHKNECGNNVIISNTYENAQDAISHSKKYTVNCEVNDKSNVNNDKEISEHVTDNRELFSCDQCGCRFKTVKGLKRHEKSHDATRKELRKRDKPIQYNVDDSDDENNDFKSNYTEDKSINEDNDNQNDIKRDIIEDQQYACGQCNRRLKSWKSLQRHHNTHLRHKNSKIKEDEEWDSDNHNNEDVDQKNEEIIKQTDEKNTLDDDKEDLKDILKIDEQNIPDIDKEIEKQYVCDECGSRLKTRKSLKRHKRIHLRLPATKPERLKAKHVCEYCQKEFCQSSSLKDHLRVHTGEQPYLCSECGKAFTSLSNMKQHFLRHGTARPYECPDCPKKFPCHSDLASHKAVHTKAKTHVCDICGAGFVKPYLLKKHKMYHTGEKKHKCDYCDMRFVLADHCRRHMRTHTGEKPYKCKYCVRAFAQSNDLIKHMRGHLGDNVYKCDLCPKGFRLQGELRTHFNTHKNDDEETRLRNLQALKEEELRLQLKFSATNAVENT